MSQQHRNDNNEIIDKKQVCGINETRKSLGFWIFLNISHQAEKKQSVLTQEVFQDKFLSKWLTLILQIKTRLEVVSKIILRIILRFMTLQWPLSLHKVIS